MVVCAVFSKTGLLSGIGFLCLMFGTPLRTEASDRIMRLEPHFSHAMGSVLYQVPPGVPQQPKRVLLIHGGGLLTGSPREERYDHLARALAGRGFETLSLSYRKLWEGGRARSNQAAFEEALGFLIERSEGPVAIVGISSGAWVGVQGLSGMALGERHAPRGSGECPSPVATHFPVDQFVGISPMVGSKGSPVLRALRMAYGRQSSDISQGAIEKLLIRGSHDPILPLESFEEWCGAGVSDQKGCEVVTLSGGHQLLSGDGADFSAVVARAAAFLEGAHDTAHKPTVDNTRLIK